MTNLMKSIKTLYLALPIAGMALSGCEADNVVPDNAGQSIPLAISSRTLTSATSGETELPAEGTLYIFSGGSAQGCIIGKLFGKCGDQREAG